MPIQAFSRPRPPAAEMPYIGRRFQFSVTPRHNAITVAAAGDLDATNADCFVYYVIRHLRGRRALALDLRYLEFCGSEGFLAVLKVRCYCKHHDVDWSLLSGEAVDRVLEIGDADSLASTAIPFDEMAASPPLAAVRRPSLARACMR